MNQMLQYVCALIHMFLTSLLIQHAESSGEMVLTVSNKNVTFYFNDSLFTRFFDCMFDKHNSCKARSTTGAHMNVYNVISSTNYHRDKKYYKCTFNEKSSYNEFKCKAEETILCGNLTINCISIYDGIVLQNVYMISSEIGSCSRSCTEKLTLYYKIKATMSPSTKPSITTPMTSASVSSTFWTTNLEFSPTSSQFYNNSINSSMASLNRSNDEDTCNTEIIIIVCVVVCIVVILCSVVGFVIWRRHRIIQNNDPSLKSSFGKVEFLENNSNGNKDFGSADSTEHIQHSTKIDGLDNTHPDLLMPGHKHIIQGYSNCVIDENYTTVTEDEGGSSISTGPNLEDKAVLYIDKASTKQPLKEDECYNKPVNKIDTKLNNLQHSEVDYYNQTEDKTSSEYQRLGQERRDLKNPYQQLLQVEQEQLVLSDQELSPYTLAKPVLGEATLQIIDVGAWIDDSYST